MKKTIEEADVGIFCYISKLPGFRGILKQRYSDFIVNEVDSDGNVVHLISLDAPLQPVEEQVTKVSDQSKISYSPEIELFRSLVGDTDANCLEAFFYQLSSGVEESMPPIVLSPDSDKSHRKAVHNFFKQNLKFLVTDTVDGPDASSKCIRVRLNSGGFQNRRRNSKKRKDRGDKPFDSRGSDDWPEHVGKFLQFHLYKENKETQEALALIAKMLGIQPRSFGFAGTKDKRSVSSQRVTVFKQHANRLAALNERLIGIKIGDFCHVKEGLLLGQLMGNRFTVTLRGVVADSEDIIKSSADSLGRHGFINYFGLQRFGSGAVPTYLIGAALLRGEWRAAVNMILDPRDGERESVRQAREYYKESDDIGGTLRQLPHYLVAERAILQSLKSCRGNYLQALKAIPRTLRMMYVHSYQSYLWNHAASMRVQKYGTEQVVLGDLVYSKEDLKENVALDSSELDDASYDNASNNGQSDEISEAVELEGKNIPVKVVTAEDLPAGKYTILDVLLPLPGSRVTYPTNDIAEVYHDLAKKDAISLTERAHNIKEFSITNMSGGYRRVFQTPIEFQWELLTYTDGNMPLAETDLDKIYLSKPMNTIRKDSDDGKKEETASFCKEQSESIGNDMESLADVRAPEDGKDAPKIVSDQKTELALKLAFTLPASSYATMAIRELLKTSTSAAFHKSLNG